MSGLMEWTVYALQVSLLVAFAAWVAARAARAFGRPARWYWLGALVLAPLVPILAYMLPDTSLAQGLSSLGAVVPIILLGGSAPFGADVAASGLVWNIPWLDVVLFCWFVASVVVAARYASGAVRLRSARRGWTSTQMAGETVLRSARTGPAVVGVANPAIVIPAWVFGLKASLQRLILKHEREHIAAFDPAMLVVSRVVVVLMPWNPVVLWLAHRLRLAIELDCDARVMHTELDGRAYGLALFEAGRRQSVLAPAFSERASWLERRMRNILGPHPRRPGKGLMLTATALGLTGLAVCTEVPGEPNVTAEPEAAAAEGESVERYVDAPPRQGSSEETAVEEMAPPPRPESGVSISESPAFVPFESPPQLVNAREVQQALKEAYPQLLRKAGIGGSTLVWFFVNEEGEVANTQLKESSGYPTMDQAALNVAQMLKFRPAQNRGESVAVWVAIPIDFSPSPETGGGG